MSKIYNNPAPAFTEALTKELNERFNRLVKNLGDKNKKGTERYSFEVDFAYALNEISKAPTYMKGKLFDGAASIVSHLINRLKSSSEVK